jgi:hypothetical protein
LGCANCKTDITHSEIPADGRLPDTFLRGAPKPEFPNEGVTVKCPNCGEAAVYERHQLTYRMS